MVLVRKPGTGWNDAWARCVALAPEAFRDDRVLNLWNGSWQADGRTLPATSPVDGSPVAGPPRLDGTTAHHAVRASLDQHRAWRHVPLAERRARVAATLDALTQHRELLALLLVWEIGKPWRLAQADVDRAIDGVGHDQTDRPERFEFDRAAQRRVAKPTVRHPRRDEDENHTREPQGEKIGQGFGKTPRRRGRGTRARSCTRARRRGRRRSRRSRRRRGGCRPRRTARPPPASPRSCRPTARSRARPARRHVR